MKFFESYINFWKYSFWGENTKRFTRLAWRSRSFVDRVLVHPLLLKVADEILLGRGTASYWMNTGQMMAVGPGSSKQVLHRDADNWYWMCEQNSPEVTVSCMFALTDFRPENGATLVVPGSQSWGEEEWERKAKTHEITQAAMPAGSGLIYSGKVIHAAGANQTDEWRQGLHLSYVAGWLTPEEAGPIGLPMEAAKQLSPLQQKLLGYRCYDDSEVNSVRLWTVDYEDIPTALGWVNNSGGRRSKL